MGVKLGSTDVSFRLGEATPSKVYFGATEVWTDVVPTVPGIPTGLTVTTDENAQSSVVVSWTMPESNGGSDLTGYRVYRSFDSFEYTLHATENETSTSVTVPGNGGQAIYIRVSALNAVGEGAESEVTWGTLSAAVPGIPVDFTMAATVVGQVTLSWSPPASDGGEAITGYSIAYSVAPSEAQYFDTVGPEDSSYTFSDNLGNTYTATVAAINSVGTGSYAEPASATIADVPGVSPSFTASTFTSSTPGAVDLSITTPSDNYSPIISYVVQRDTDDTFPGVVFDGPFTDHAAPGSAFNKTISGLQGGQLYYFRVRFTNAVGDGDWATSTTGANASPSVPTQVTGFSVAPDYVNEEWSAAWSAPADGGSVLTGYEIQESGSDNFTSATTSYPGSSATDFQYAVASPDATRYFRIRATNSVGAGQWSDTVSAYYDTPTVPGAPTITAAQYDDDTGDTVIFYTPPGDDGNSPITDYNFYFDGVPATPDQAGAGTYTFYSNFTGQDCEMSAVNAVGEGALSAAVEVVLI